jgi:CheY-like chemotaxis protein
VLQPRVLDLNEVVRGLEKMLKRLLLSDIVLETTLDPGLGRVSADPGQLEQVLMNLAVNARDAMPKGGRLTIETANVELDEAYCAAHASGAAAEAIQPGSHVSLSVSDTGCGMSEEVRAHIFEPFYTTKERGKGTGLGLSTVYGIVQQSGGHIWCYSEVGHGTTFKIYLPRVQAADEPSGVVEAHLAPRAGSGTLLLVDDDDAVRTAAGRILRRQGYTVLAAASGAEALEIAEQYADPIGLVVTDMVMPEMGGPELASRLRALRPELMVVFMSGYTEDAALRNRLLEPGAVFVEKPFTFEALTSKVRDALDAYRTGGAPARV